MHLEGTFSFSGFCFGNNVRYVVKSMWTDLFVTVFFFGFGDDWFAQIPHSYFVYRQQHRLRASVMPTLWLKLQPCSDLSVLVRNIQIYTVQLS